MTLTEYRKHILRIHGFHVGERDPTRNASFEGQYMVADLDSAPGPDASSGGYCIVGDDLDALVNEAFQHFGLS